MVLSGCCGTYGSNAGAFFDGTGKATGETGFSGIGGG